MVERSSRGVTLDELHDPRLRQTDKRGDLASRNARAVGVADQPVAIGAGALQPLPALRQRSTKPLDPFRSRHAPISLLIAAVCCDATDPSRRCDTSDACQRSAKPSWVRLVQAALRVGTRGYSGAARV